MKSSAIVILFGVVSLCVVLPYNAVSSLIFSQPRTFRHQRRTTTFTPLWVATDPITDLSEESAIDAVSESDISDVTIPTNLPSDCGMDYVPLASMLATGQLVEADQVCYPQND
jgi:hypothetical protein